MASWWNPFAPLTYGDDGGHHDLPQADFKNTTGYTPTQHVAVGNAQMAAQKLRHQEATNAHMNLDKLAHAEGINPTQAFFNAKAYLGLRAMGMGVTDAQAHADAARGRANELGQFESNLPYGGRKKR